MSKFKDAPTQAIDKLNNKLAEGDIVAFIYHGSGADLKIGKIVEIKLSKRNGIRGLWAFCQIIGVDDREYEGTQWCLATKMLKLKTDMLNDVMLAKLSSESGKKQNIDLIPKETVNKIKKAFKDRGFMTNYRCRNFRQVIKVSYHDDFEESRRFDITYLEKMRSKRTDAIKEVCAQFNIPDPSNKWGYVSNSIYINQ